MRRTRWTQTVFAAAAVCCLADGANWTQIDAGLPRTAAGVSQVVVDPLAPSTVYAVGSNTPSLFRSADGGGTWALLTSITGVLALAIDPANSSTLYASANGVVMKSIDAGQSWSNTGDGPTGVVGLAIDPQNDAVVYALAGVAIFKSTDGGANWSAKTAGLPSSMSPHNLVFDPGNTSVLYVGVGGNSAVYQSMDAGESWRMVSPPPGPGGGICICGLAIDPTHSSTIYAVLFTPTAPAANENLFRLYKTIDGGTTWSASDAGIPGVVLSLVVDADSTVYAAWSGTGAGLVKSTDGGASWSALDTGLPSDAPPIKSLALIPGNPSTLFAGYLDSLGGGGVFKTADGGANWQDSSSGLTFLRVNALAVDPSNSETVYVAAADGVSKTADGGQDWTTVHFPSPVISNNPFGLVQGTPYVPSIVIDPHNTNVLYASFVTTSGCYFMDPFLRKSTDGGATWNTLGVTYCTAGPKVFLALDPDNSSSLFAAPQDGADCGAYVYDTNDGGIDWDQNFISGAYITALGIAPGNPPVLYAAYNLIGSPSNGGLFKSTDAATTWIATGLTDVVTALAVDPADGNTIYAGTANGLSKTTDGGATWTLVYALSEGSVTALAIQPKSGVLYIGTSQSGVYKSSGGARWISLNDGLPSLSIQALAVGSDESSTIYASTAGGVFRTTDSPQVNFQRRR